MDNEQDKLGVILAAYMRDEINGGYFVMARLANYFEGHSLCVLPVVMMNDRQGFVEAFVDQSVKRCLFEIPTAISVVQRRSLTLSKLVGAGLALLTLLPSLLLQVRRISREYHVKLIHTHSLTAAVLIGLVGRLSGLKFVYHFHDSFTPISAGGTLDPTTKRIVLFLMTWMAHRIVVVSDFVKTSIVQEQPQLAAKILVIPNGLDLGRIRQVNITTYRGGVPVLLSYGTLAERKGFQVVIHAVRILRNDFGIDVKYRIVGDGPNFDSLLRLASDLGVSDLVEFVGFKKDVLSSVASADIVVIPPIYEDPMPLVVIEAMANSKIIVASRSGGIPEMISDGVHGYLVEKGNALQIANKIHWIMQYPNDANQLAENAYQRCQECFTIERMGERIEEFYIRLAGANI